MTKQITDTSKFLSFVLRHEPLAIGLTLDSEGWAEISALIDGANNAGHSLDRVLLALVVETSEKKRFSISADGLRIRAAQGHSTDAVAIRYAEKVPPAQLFHGTANRFLATIMAAGLTPQARQHVHLTDDLPTAMAVGQRYGSPVLLTINAQQMYQQGYKFYQADNGVWLTAAVPVGFITTAQSPRL